MNVFFGTTTSQWKDYKNYYFAIRERLIKLGCTFPFDWLEGADRYYNTSYKERNISKIFKEVVSAIDLSDIIVIEYTVPNFSSSHQINYALLKKKPTLVMRLKKDNPRFSDSYLEAIDSPLLTLKDYSIKTLDSAIEEFVQLNQLDPGNSRYNIVLDRSQKYYLDWATIRYKKSRSQIIRELIDAMKDNDKDFS